MEWMIMPLKRYAEFSGRSRRMELWMWVLFTVIVSIVLGILDGLLGFSTSRSTLTPAATGVGFAAMTNIGVLGGIWSLATLVPSLAVSVRRLHDTNRAGWWLLLPMVPYFLGFAMMFMAMTSQSLGMIGFGGVLMLIGFIGAIVLLVFYCLPGTPGPNDYGPDPLGGTANLAETFQ
jgi:uncharacterized membrane protein YhaH (DUF805 family)